MRNVGPACRSGFELGVGGKAIPPAAGSIDDIDDCAVRGKAAVFRSVRDSHDTTAVASTDTVYRQFHNFFYCAVSN